MAANQWIRQGHRWLSMAFTLGTLVNVAFFVVGKAQPPGWVGALAAVPLILLMLSGLYLFALPYLPKARATPSCSEPASARSST